MSVMLSLFLYQHYPFPLHHPQLSSSWALGSLGVGEEEEEEEDEDLYSWLPLLGPSVGSWAVEDFLTCNPNMLEKVSS